MDGFTEAQRRELAGLMNRSRVEVRDGEVLMTCKTPEDLDRAYDLLTAQGREPERCNRRRLIICRGKGVPQK